MPMEFLNCLASHVRMCPSQMPPSPQTSPQRIVLDDWGEYFDETTRRPFYYNTRTREKRWKPPRKGIHSVAIPEVSFIFFFLLLSWISYVALCVYLWMQKLQWSCQYVREGGAESNMIIIGTVYLGFKWLFHSSVLAKLVYIMGQKQILMCRVLPAFERMMGSG